MNLQIQHAVMEKTEEGYLGKIEFRVEGHKEAYEITLQSKNSLDWGYSLHFLGDSGPDEEIEALDNYIEENDDAFELFIDAARTAYEAQE